MAFIHFKSAHTKISISNITDIQLTLDLIVIGMSIVQAYLFINLYQNLGLSTALSMPVPLDNKGT